VACAAGTPVQLARQPDAGAGFAPIGHLRFGQRVHTDAPREARERITAEVAAAGEDGGSGRQSAAGTGGPAAGMTMEIDAAQWRTVVLRAVDPSGAAWKSLCLGRSSGSPSAWRIGQPDCGPAHQTRPPA